MAYQCFISAFSTPAITGPSPLSDLGTTVLQGCSRRSQYGTRCDYVIDDYYQFTFEGANGAEVIRIIVTVRGRLQMQEG